MISPFLAEKLVVSGASAGLSAATYDIRIGHDLVLGPNPSAVIEDMARRCSSGVQMVEYAYAAIKSKPSYCSLAHSLESFAIPRDVAAHIYDKSTYARRFTAAFNTLFDPGFVGTATLELVNLGGETITILAGDPICQIAFEWLDQPTNRPYAGKYQDQPARAVPARLERIGGGYVEEGMYPN